MAKTDVEAAFRTRGFNLESLGGNVEQYLLQIDEVDVIVSTPIGVPPEKLSEPVLVNISRYGTDDAVMQLKFDTLNAFFRAFDEGAGSK